MASLLSRIQLSHGSLSQGLVALDSLAAT